MALGALKAADQLGRRVPDDLGVVGFDDIPEAAFFKPALTTVRHDLLELGRLAVRELHRVYSGTPKRSTRNGHVARAPAATGGARERLTRHRR